jgi:hypothetical protein
VAVALDREAIEVLRQPKLESEELRLKVRLAEELEPILQLFGADEEVEDVENPHRNTVAESEAVRARKPRDALAAPEDKIVKLQDHEEVLRRPGRRSSKSAGRAAPRRGQGVKG